MKTKHIHRDIPLFVSFAGSVIILLLLVAACDNKDYSKASPFDNAVYIDAAKVKDVANFTFNNLKQTGQQELSAVLAYPAEQDIDVNFQVVLNSTLQFAIHVDSGSLCFGVISHGYMIPFAWLQQFSFVCLGEFNLVGGKLQLLFGES